MAILQWRSRVLRVAEDVNLFRDTKIISIIIMLEFEVALLQR